MVGVAVASLHVVFLFGLLYDQRLSSQQHGRNRRSIFQR